MKHSTTKHKIPVRQKNQIIKFKYLHLMLLRFKSDQVVCGVDEAGRGCLAGPVVAAAVILPKKFRNKILNDSKQLRVEQRDELRILIEKKALAFAVGIVDNNKIDEI